MSLLACLFLAAGCSAQPLVAELSHGWERSSQFDGIRYLTAGVQLPRLDFGDATLGWYVDIGVLQADDGDKDALIVGLGPALQYRLPFTGERLLLEIASRPTALSRSRFDDTELGGRFHFASHAGLRWRSRRRRWEAGFRFVHISNASTRGTNPGINFAILSIGWQAGR